MAARRFLIGYDVGSSSIKATILDSEGGAPLASAFSPSTELPIRAPKPGWAEQDPEEWWKHVVLATRAVQEKSGVRLDEAAAIGIAYQMHGLVLVDKSMKVIRPAIIWCDSRAVETGERALREIGPEKCLASLLNSPGNFTATRLIWVKENEPEFFTRISKVMLPGDYIALKMTGEAVTTQSGLSECILWDFSRGGMAQFLLERYGIPREIIPDIVPTFSPQGGLAPAAAKELGLPKGIPVSYRAGDQPNNAFSLKVLDPGEAAATGGTSGVVYGVTDKPLADNRSRVNTFVHVNHGQERPRYGVLLCLNGTGILYSWMRRMLKPAGGSLSYQELNTLAARAGPGSDGLVVLPFGNGAERALDNRSVGGAFVNLDLVRHSVSHILRASLEGIVFGLRFGMEVMKEMGMDVRTVRAGHSGMFLSELFTEIFSSATGARVELFDTDGSQGAARGSGVGAGVFPDMKTALAGLAAVRTVEPRSELTSAYSGAYGKWKEALRKMLL
jgi:xylulokinase